MTGLELVELAVATLAAVHVWFEGSLFAGLRARVETWALAEETTRLGQLKLLGNELLSCRLCLTYQVAIWLTLFHLVATRFPTTLLQLVPTRLDAVVYAGVCLLYGLTQGLAVAGIAWFVSKLWAQR
jgi:hypothetical protein